MTAKFSAGEAHSDAHTSVSVHVSVEGGERFTALGKAKRNPVDEPDQYTGELLATARALLDLSEQLEAAAGVRIANAEQERVREETRARALVAHNDSVNRPGKTCWPPEARVGDPVYLDGRFVGRITRIDGSAYEVAMPDPFDDNPRHEGEGGNLNRPNHLVHDSLGDPDACTGNHNHPATAQHPARRSDEVFFAPLGTEEPKTISRPGAPWQTFGFGAQITYGPDGDWAPRAPLSTPPPVTVKHRPVWSDLQLAIRWVRKDGRLGTPFDVDDPAHKKAHRGGAPIGFGAKGTKIGA